MNFYEGEKKLKKRAFIFPGNCMESRETHLHSIPIIDCLFKHFEQMQ